MAPAEYQNTFSNSLNYGLQVGHNTGNIETHHHYAADNPLTRLIYSKNARFNSNYRQHAQICHENTRTDLLRDIYNWVDGEDERHIFWLQGLAGTGKSTIAQTVAKHYYDLSPKRLAASFFFARGGGDASHAGLFATSIAVQLANDVPQLHDAVCMAITKCSDIASRSLSDQWRRLVLQPFSSLETNSPSSYLIVIDALDECNGKNDIQTIFQLLSEARQLIPLRLRFFLTSRPDTVIRRGFQEVPTVDRRDVILHQIERALVNHDIALYCNHELALIRQEQYLEPDWPILEEIQRLVNKSSGLFIWAATACRYIRQGRNNAEERLSMVLNTQIHDSGPEKELDAIYTMVLINSVPGNFSNEEKEKLYARLVHLLGSVVILFAPLSIHALNTLLDISVNEIKRTIIDLHSILHVPLEEHNDLRLHHPSFRDYLVNPTRCGLKSLQVSEEGAHRRLLFDCLDLMSATLKENICDLDYSNPGILRAEVEERHVQQSIHPALRYACLYWVQHLQRSSQMIYDKDQVDNFMRQHLLAWLEALSWMGRAAESIQVVTCLQSIASDVRRFISYTYPIVERAPLQLYLSALIFTPESSHIRSHFQRRVFRWMKKLPVTEKNWSSLLQTLESHAGRVNAIAFSPDGTMLASASFDCTVQLWDTATGSARQTLEGHTDRVTAIAFSLDGTMLASASGDRTVRLWDTATGNARKTLEGHTDWVRAIAFSPDGTMLASASDDCTVRLWDTATGNARKTLEGHTDEARAIAFSPDGTMLASASEDHTVRLWDTATGNARKTLKGHTDWVRAIAFSPDGTMLASASYDCTVRLWDTATGNARQTLKGHTDWVRAIAFSPDGTMLASASGDRTVRLWDTATGNARKTLEGHTDEVRAIAFSPDGTVLASASDDCTVRLWDTATGNARQTLKGHTDRVKVIAFSPDGIMLASASYDCTIRLWDTATENTRQTLEGHTDRVKAMAFSPDGTVLASASDDCTVRLWDTATGNARKTLEGHTDELRAIAFSPDGTMLASASGDRTVRLWDTATGNARQTLKGHTNSVNAIAFSLDGTMLASASYDCTIRLWNTVTGVYQTLEGHTHSVTAIAFSPDGTVLITDKGRIHINSHDVTSHSQPQHVVPAPKVVIENQWIACNGYNILWLPPEYRSNVSAVYATKVAIGCSLGQVLLFELDIF
ncbi:WD-repeat protein, putative [Talaromyces stipitatus ATCC 10500]|uniref:WD-repeat protein, putative n=1 Tax=Talaromyces stipitatus (strain ATCC 10500 / CBS 375.48 / QM 6759 / NRRL 1006) TaxID=441959 RepID=B8MUB1_TALSN|nr:WD-repeat protein, putative [Talaromyces stipitatus ATCC 10500]EED11615.1 WD-repeat protein, putative [Talaromyces stipitatus ATCC 10500]